MEAFWDLKGKVDALAEHAGVRLEKRWVEQEPIKNMKTGWVTVNKKTGKTVKKTHTITSSE